MTSRLTSLRETAANTTRHHHQPSTSTTPRLDDGAMAASSSQVTNASSDYGSDIGLEEIDEATLTSLDELKQTILAEDEPGPLQVAPPAVLRIAKRGQDDHQVLPVHEQEILQVVHDEQGVSSVARENSIPLTNKSGQDASTTLRNARSSSPPPTTRHALELEEQDSRPPIERFRTKPKKPFSVTDLVSPAWCELQYFYTLAVFGRKKRTKAMKTGSKIHQTLEDEVHTTVPVHITSKEDGFALRIWNAISGLRCLRETGLTRELEVWGLIEGQVVNGVIDELSYIPPDASAKTHPYYTDKEGLVFDDCEAGRQVYLTDVKTRSVDSLPGVVALRPTCMQLMLYRHLLEKLASNTVDAEAIFARYQLQPLESLTETFLEDISDIGAQEASAYPNLLSLWSLLVTELQMTFPTNTLSPILRAEFRSARSGDVLGSQLFKYEEEEVEKWTADQFAWWQGQRQPRGVDIEEAYKCKSCEFVDGCGWRKSKIEEAVTKSRLRAERMVKSIV